MSVESHVQELRRKHQSLSDQIEAARRCPGMDDLSISQMKKEKLRLKEEISRLSH
ncbi:MAG TPA: YdcH family protein [Paracoccus sp. (in: a-proteobacteria)]|uniref:YdcH family protein n=1 Tax=Paracoccus sp. TaxID=267 RepID=UPI002C759F4A|nr:YdcH family protein [Paracoccus sp. (in: a-proteobacteria)]HWL56651.1 YdcH family protein [Paracoccus sp. (in: a-proteobacteria)]